MRSYDSFGAFAEHLIAVSAKTKIALHEGVKQASEAIEKEAKAEIGHYQDAFGTFQGDVGVFPAWEQLAPSTEKRKEQLGYPLDSPLLATGELRDSITHEVIGLKGVVGTPDIVALYQEMGTETIPPRPFLGPAAARNEKKVLRILSDAVGAALIGGDWMHAPLGKDRTTD